MLASRKSRICKCSTKARLRSWKNRTDPDPQRNKRITAWWLAHVKDWIEMRGSLGEGPAWSQSAETYSEWIKLSLKCCQTKNLLIRLLGCTSCTFLCIYGNCPPPNDVGTIRELAGQGRALYGPMPVKTETFRELSAPLVHTNIGGNSCGPIIGPYLFLGKFVWTNGPESSSKVYPYTGIGPWMALPSWGEGNVPRWGGWKLLPPNHKVLHKSPELGTMDQRRKPIANTEIAAIFAICDCQKNAKF